MVSYDITITNPCEDTELFIANTTFADASYELGAKALYKSFDAVTDTVSNGITTSGNCGNIVYTLFNSDAVIGTSFLEVSDLLNSKAIKIYSENEENVGTFTIAVVVTMENYPEKTESFTFELEILEPVVIEAAIVSFAPVLITDVSESFSLEAGEPWSLFLDATDPDNDLATIDVTFSGTSADWI